MKENWSKRAKKKCIKCGKYYTLDCFRLRKDNHFRPTVLIPLDRYDIKSLLEMLSGERLRKLGGKVVDLSWLVPDDRTHFMKCDQDTKDDMNMRTTILKVLNYAMQKREYRGISFTFDQRNWLRDDIMSYIEMIVQAHYDERELEVDIFFSDKILDAINMHVVDFMESECNFASRPTL